LSPRSAAIAESLGWERSGTPGSFEYKREPAKWATAID
jgi:hypothetical protein